MILTLSDDISPGWRAAARVLPLLVSASPFEFGLGPGRERRARPVARGTL
jgi:hypothetical protein